MFLIVVCWTLVMEKRSFAETRIIEKKNIERVANI